MTLYWFTIAYAVFFFAFFLKDRRRLINGFLFLVLLVMAGLSLLMLAYETENPVLFLLIALLAALASLAIGGGAVIVMIVSFVNGVILLHKEGRRPANFLSVGFGAVILAWMWILFAFVTMRKNTVLTTIFQVVSVLLFYLVFVLLLFLVASFIYRVYRPIRKVDYLIVLGAGLLHGKEVSPLLAGRIEKALSIYWRQVKRKKAPPVLVMSGGQGGDEEIPEAVAMRQYALSRGIPETQILVEDQSKNTYENMCFSKRLIEAQEPGRKRLHILFATTNYHVFRAGLYARKAHLQAQGVGAKTKFYFWYNAILREYIAVLGMYKKAHVICMAVLLGLFAFVQLVVYNYGLARWLVTQLGGFVG